MTDSSILNRQTPATVGLREAAEVLGLTPEGVRKRVLRGQLPATKNSDGIWVIHKSTLDTHAPNGHQPTTSTQTDARTNSPDTSANQLITTLQQENARLWAELERRTAELEAEHQRQSDELERRAEELRRKDMLMAELTRRLPALPETCPDPPRRSWWQRLFSAA